MKKSVYKIPGGKMVRVSLEEQDKVIKAIKITGDFFLYPEERLSDLEQGLIGIHLDNLLEVIKKIVKEKEIILFGLTPEGIVTAINLAINNHE